MLCSGLPTNSRPKKQFRFRALWVNATFKKLIASASLRFRDAFGARACVQVPCVPKSRRFVFALLSPVMRGLAMLLSLQQQQLTHPNHAFIALDLKNSFGSLHRKLHKQTLINLCCQSLDGGSAPLCLLGLFAVLALMEAVTRSSRGMGSPRKETCVQEILGENTHPRHLC